MHLVVNRHGFTFVVAGHAERGDAPVQRHQKQPFHFLRRLIQVIVRVNQTRDEKFSSRVDDGRALRHLHARARAGRRNAIAVHNNDGVVDCGTTRAVDQLGAHDGGDRAGGAALRV